MYLVILFLSLTHGLFAAKDNFIVEYTNETVKQIQKNNKEIQKNNKKIQKYNKQIQKNNNILFVLSETRFQDQWNTMTDEGKGEFLKKTDIHGFTPINYLEAWKRSDALALVNGYLDKNPSVRDSLLELRQNLISKSSYDVLLGIINQFTVANIVVLGVYFHIFQQPRNFTREEKTHIVQSITSKLDGANKKDAVVFALRLLRHKDLDFDLDDENYKKHIVSFLIHLNTFLKEESLHLTSAQESLITDVLTLEFLDQLESVEPEQVEALRSLLKKNGNDLHVKEIAIWTFFGILAAVACGVGKGILNININKKDQNMNELPSEVPSE